MKTIEEAATDFSKDIRENSLTGNNACKQQYQVGRKIGFNAGVEFAQSWISVEDELPENDTIKVLVKKDNEFISLAFYSKHIGWHNTLSFKIGEVTHWRPIELK